MIDTDEGVQAAEAPAVEADGAQTDELGTAIDETAGVEGATTEQPDDSEALAAVPTSERESTAEEFRTFTDQPIVVLGEQTTDHRILDPKGEFTFRKCPQPLQWCERNEGGHMSSTTVGVIEKMSQDGNKIRASGYLLNTPEAERAANLLAHRVASPSADLSSAEWHYTTEKGKKLDSNEAIMEHLESGGTLHRKITTGHIVGATLVPFPAIGSAALKLNDKREVRDVGLVASAAEDFKPRVYPAELFEDPKLSGPTMTTMSDSGRIYGHLAVFGQCHRSVQSNCVMVPRSPSGYAHFHTSPAVRLTDGKRLPVGRLTVGTGHADPGLRPVPALAHYDNTGACFALVRVGEDEHGIWFSGVAAPWATAEQIEVGLASPLSGDWRNFGQGLELIAALSVNTPGFAVQGRDDDDGHPAALVASVGPVRSTSRGVPFTLDDIRDVVREVFADVTAEEQQAAELAQAETAAPEAPPELEAAQAITEQELEAGRSVADQIDELLQRADA